MSGTWNHQAATYLRAFLGTHATRMQAALYRSDRGASAIELAIITAVLVGLAVVILGIIVTFANTQGANIQKQVVPNP
jgi:Flp pilus assembly protein TadG